MESNLDKIALDLYGKIQTRFPNIQVGNESGDVITRKKEMNQGRFFEFEYKENGESLGTITITLDDDEGIVVQLAGDLVDRKHPRCGEFLKGLRIFAKKRLLKYDEQNIGKDSLDKRDYHYQSKPKEEPVMPQAPIMENKMYGNARMSYQDLGEARLVVKHSQPVNFDLAAGRTMHIDSIYIENSQGERFRYPYKHLNGARALAEHIKHGGTPYDSIGKHISSLSEELASLRKFKGYVNRQAQVSEAMGNVTDRVLNRIDQIKETIHKLQRPAYYEAFVESFEEQEELMIPEEITNDLINRLTIRTFNEDLKAVFPYIYKFIDESELPVLEINADDLLSENPLLIGIGKAGMKNGASMAATGVKALPAHLDPNLRIAFNKGVELGQVAKRNPKDPRVVGFSMEQAGIPKEYRDHFRQGFYMVMPNGLPESVQPEDQFESFMDSIVTEDDQDEYGQGIFDHNPDVKQSNLKKVNQIFSADKLTAGVAGINLEELTKLIPLPAFISKIEELKQITKDSTDKDVTTTIEVMLTELAQDNEELAEILQNGLIDFGGNGGAVGGEEAPVATPAPAAAPPVPPVAEVPPAPEAVPPIAAPAEPLPPEVPAAPIAEGVTDMDEFRDKVEWLMGKPNYLSRDEAKETAYYDEDPDTWKDSPWEDDYRDIDEGEDDDAPWHKHTPHDAPKDTFKKPMKPGGEKDRLKALIHRAISKGATGDHTMDLGSREIKLHDAIKECGMDPKEFGLEPEVNGTEEMIKFISGFYDKESGAFPLGAMRIKIKLKKAAEDGAFGDVAEDELGKVLKFIDMKDPGAGNAEHEQHAILRLAGISHNDRTVDEEVPDFSNIMKGMGGDVNSMFNQMKSTPGANVTSTSSSSGNTTNNPMDAAQFDKLQQLMKQFQNAKLKIGDQEFGIDALNDPDKMGQQIQKGIGGIFQGLQGQMPNQPVQLPGNSGQFNPQEMMKHIMSLMPKN